VRTAICLSIFFLLFRLLSFAQYPIHAYNTTVLQPTGFSGVEGHVFDAETGASLPARIVIRDSLSNVIDSYYDKLPGFFTDERGTFKQHLSAGTYSINIFHGIDYVSQEISVTIAGNSGFNAAIYLKPWFHLKKNGWYCGDGHDHLYTDIQPDTAMVAKVRKICLAQGVDFVCAAQGWAGYNDSTWRQGYKAFNDNNFQIYYGSEMPKYRTGHTWWIGQNSTLNYFWSTMDTVYENNFYQTNNKATSNFNDLSFPNIPDVDVVQGFKLLDQSIPIMAHPTSWWWQKTDSTEKYITNVAAGLSFGLLAGKIWDGMAVMGYDPDHYFYQNLWFHVLNEGYRMPALAELDGGYGKGDKFYYGSMRAYYHIDGLFSMKKLKEAIRKNRTFVTSGPIIIADVDKKYELGDVVPNGQSHTLHLQAYASGEKDDYLSYILIFRNGHIFKLWDIRKEKLRKFNTALTITEKEKAWYIIKVYGKNAWSHPEFLDVMRVCERDSLQQFADYNKERIDVAFTSPFYFWSENVKEPEAELSEVNLTIIAPGTSIPLNNCKVEIWIQGKKWKTLMLKNGQGTFMMPINGVVKISSPGFAPIYRTLYLDYAPHRQLLEELLTGKWREKYGTAKIFNPGEVPWEEFHFRKTKQILSKVNWEIEMARNERDGQWEKFDHLFNLPTGLKK
jgi:hypothetical protein